MQKLTTGDKCKVVAGSVIGAAMCYGVPWLLYIAAVAVEQNV